MGGFDAELPDETSPQQLAPSLENDPAVIAEVKAALVASLVLSNPAVTAADVNIQGIKAKPGTDPAEMEIIYEVHTEDETAPLMSFSLSLFLSSLIQAAWAISTLTYGSSPIPYWSDSAALLRE